MKLFFVKNSMMKYLFGFLLMILMYYIKIVFVGLEVFNYKVVLNLRDKILMDLVVFYMRNILLV